MNYVVILAILANTIIENHSLKPLSIVKNGVLANSTQFPFVVGIYHYSGMLHCTGSLLTLSKVLTAAHCVNEKPFIFRFIHKITVIAGVARLPHSVTNHNGQQRQVKELIIHPNATKQKPLSLEYNLAILMVNTPFNASKYVSVVSISRKEMDIQARCKAVGFGYHKVIDEDLDGQLRYGELYDKHKNLRLYCLVSEDILYNAMPIDSGGPMINLEPDFSIYGVCSHGVPGKVNVYVNTAVFRKWIFKPIENRSKGLKLDFLHQCIFMFLFYIFMMF